MPACVGMTDSTIPVSVRSILFLTDSGCACQLNRMIVLRHDGGNGCLVTSIDPRGRLGQDGRLAVGDIILGINIIFGMTDLINTIPD